jgi:Protein of unknown function (DUF3800)
MYLAYYDESGDDGHQPTSSPLFTLSVVYQHHLVWKDNYETVKKFKRQLAIDFPFPFHEELHTREFILNKKPYNQWNIADGDRAHVIDLYCELCAQLELRIINVVIVKSRFHKPEVNVLDTALTFSVQRIENDLAPSPQNRFMIITDWGRVGKMRKTTRRVQKINFIPSKFGPIPRRQDIQKLIEDPLPKDSSESYFIQLADLSACIVSLYAVITQGVGHLPKRLPGVINAERVTQWMEMLKASLNVKAAGDDQYGVKFHPAA